MCNVNCACNLVHYTHVLELEKAPVNAFINIAILLLVCVDCVLLLVRPSNNLINISTLKVYTYATTMEEEMNPNLFLCVFLASLSTTLANA